MVQFVENTALVRAPGGSDQQIFRPVTGDPVDHDVRGQMGETGDDQIDIGIEGQNLELTCQVIVRQIGIFQHMQELQFDAERLDPV